MNAHPVRPAALDTALAQVRAFAGRHPGLLVEDKSFGVALHYRQVPAMETDVRTWMTALGQALGLFLQPGKMMAELRPPGGDKGKAVHALMARPPMRGTRPIFVGDDHTDEPGFAAAQALGGVGIRVGTDAAGGADYRLADPAAVRDWLGALLA